MMTDFTIQADSRLLRNPDVILREDEPGGPLLFNLENSEMLVLNETGLWIWHHCDREITLGALARMLLDLYDQENPGQVENDLHTFVQNMASQGFIGILC